jgi:hypothetical protein
VGCSDSAGLRALDLSSLEETEGIANTLVTSTLAKDLACVSPDEALYRGFQCLTLERPEIFLEIRRVACRNRGHIY